MEFSMSSSQRPTRWDRDLAADEFTAAVYDELRALATHYLSAERPDHTLQPTALVHEAYVRLVRSKPLVVKGRAHFVAIAARVMRQVLVDHARRRMAEKRGGGNAARIALTDLKEDMAVKEIDLVTLDDALLSLAELDPRMCRVVELRFFGGLSNAEVAEAMSISPRTVEREWSLARAWLHQKIARE